MTITVGTCLRSINDRYRIRTRPGSSQAGRALIGLVRNRAQGCYGLLGRPSSRIALASVWIAFLLAGPRPLAEASSQQRSLNELVVWRQALTISIVPKIKKEQFILNFVPLQPPTQTTVENGAGAGTDGGHSGPAPRPVEQIQRRSRNAHARIEPLLLAAGHHQHHAAGKGRGPREAHAPHRRPPHRLERSVVGHKHSAHDLRLSGGRQHGRAAGQARGPPRGRQHRPVPRDAHHAARGHGRDPRRGRRRAVGAVAGHRARAGRARRREGPRQDLRELPARGHRAGTGGEFFSPRNIHPSWHTGGWTGLNRWTDEVGGRSRWVTRLTTTSPPRTTNSALSWRRARPATPCSPLAGRNTRILRRV